MKDKDIKILEEFISNYKDIQEKYKDDEIQAEIERSCYFEEAPAIQIENLIQAYKQYEEKLMYALNPTNSELAIKTKEDFKKIIRENINEDTYTIKKELKKYWNNMDDYFKDIKDEYKQFDIEEFINYKINKGMQEDRGTFPID